MAHNHYLADGLEDLKNFSLERRVRQITSIQVCNLTLFPIRDAFASALSQPSEQPNFTIHGHLSDDLDLTLSRKRGRKFSSASHATNLSFQSDEDSKHGTLELRSRKSSNPKVSFPAGGPALGSSNSGGRAQPQPQRPTSPAIANKNLRSRTISLGSTKFSSVNGVSGSSFTSGGLDNSQVNLENIISLRLVETILTITVPPSKEPDSNHIRPSPLPHHNPASPRANGRLESPSVSQKKTRVQPKSVESGTPALRRNSVAVTRSISTGTPPSHAKASSMSAPRTQLKIVTSPSSQPKKSPISPPPSATVSHSQPSVPNYISSIHRPSTNPRFSIDAKSKRDFAPWTDLSSQVLQVQILGKIPDNIQDNGKGKQRESTVSLTGNPVQWKVLEEWVFKMADLQPVPDSPNFTAHLPSNTLLITLNPPDQTYFLPPKNLSSRPISPGAGYNSDSEAVKGVNRGRDSEAPSRDSLDVSSVKARRRHRGRHADPDSALELAKTASWHDLFNLVELQSCIADTKNSMQHIVSGINETLEGDYLPTLKREVSERQNVIGDLRANRAQVLDDCANLKLEIEERRRKFEERQELLALAKQQHFEETEGTHSIEQDVLQNEIGLKVLRSQFGPIRTTLLSTLSSIYPIELLSPPDLLYTILDVPLPIPLSSNDPAPPLSLPSHKSVNEDSVATALGYVAQVVQLLAAYLGKKLIYPVTCLGSRSLIRDNISAMVGPRMFPLFSRGVDTYRFEYGVFLLNKNIELLMSDRELRAMDMRHTLPNLKNLLLTLTDGEGAPLRAPSVDSPMSLASEIDPGDDGGAAGNTDPSTPKPKNRELSTSSTESESTTPPASGSTTPTVSTLSDSVKRNRPFLGLVPLAGFLRGRYPSTSSWTSSSNTKAEPPSREHEQVDGANKAQSSDGAAPTAEDEDDDRRTIHAVVIDSVIDGDKSSADNGGDDVKQNADDTSLSLTPHHANAKANGGIEKDLSTHNPSPSPIAHINVNVNV
ncbi:hypothetical protein AX16_000559 [Volvariella volvacea WC 439]|nr:hypothetical protein AX16_000559 [Volvariella volvacea WC 439]